MLYFINIHINECKYTSTVATFEICYEYNFSMTTILYEFLFCLKIINIKILKQEIVLKPNINKFKES
jgi:hypothetical protein